MPKWFTLSCISNKYGDALFIANEFYKSDLFEAAEPAFFLEKSVACANDDLFSEQWNLKNTNQYNSANIDIKFCAANNFTKGSDNVIIGIIDNPLEKNHPDFNNFTRDQLGPDYSELTGTAKTYSVHGITVAGIMSATGNNNLGVTGIAPGCPLLGTGWLIGTPNQLQDVADGINFAWQNGAAVINGSVLTSQSQLISDAIEDAMTYGRGGLGTVMVFAVGNENDNVYFPASAHEQVLAVGAVNPCGTRCTDGVCNLQADGGSNWGPELDVMAPGQFIYSTDATGTQGYNASNNNNINSYVNINFGTSFAAPHVAALAALCISVNPYLTQAEVCEIIEEEAQKVGGYNYATVNGRPNGTWHEEMGYGLIDAQAAVDAAKMRCENNEYDLYGKDNNFDIGIEPHSGNNFPFSRNPYFCFTDDIWIRNQNDGFVNQVHQNAEYTNGQPVYVYVKVRNKGCEASSGNMDEELVLYWAKGSTSLGWPKPWDGSSNISGQPPLGNYIGAQAIPVIESMDYKIFEFEWFPPNPAQYDMLFGGQSKHFCLLARILEDKPDFGMFKIENDDLYDNVKKNNNIIQKNIILSDLVPGNPPPVYKNCVITRNITAPFVPLKLKLSIPEYETGQSLFDRGIVQIELQPAMHDAWVLGGKLGEGIVEVGDLITAVQPNAWIGNIVLPKDTIYSTCIKYTFNNSLAQEHDVTLHLDLMQYDTNKIIGGERFEYRIDVTDSSGPIGMNNVKKTNPQKPLVKIFPNPSSGIVKLQNDNNSNIMGNLFDVKGNVLFTTKFKDNSSIDISFLNPGFYYFHFYNYEYNTTQVAKLLIIKP